jgi:hypothetical protein
VLYFEFMLACREGTGEGNVAELEWECREEVDGREVDVDRMEEDLDGPRDGVCS